MKKVHNDEEEPPPLVVADTLTRSTAAITATAAPSNSSVDINGGSGNDCIGKDDPSGKVLRDNDNDNDNESTMSSSSTSTSVSASACSSPSSHSPYLENLLILPPKQKRGQKDSLSTLLSPSSSSSSSSGTGVVRLPPIRAEEPVASLRAALGEVLGYAHLTRYRLVLERRKSIDDIKEEGGEAAAVAAAAAVEEGGGGDGGQKGLGGDGDMVKAAGGGDDVKAQGRIHSQKSKTSKDASSMPQEQQQQQQQQHKTGAANAGTGKGKRGKKKKGKGGKGGKGGNATDDNGGGGGGKNTSSTKATAAHSSRSRDTFTVISPFTGPDAIVAVPHAMRSLEADPATYTPLLLPIDAAAAAFKLKKARAEAEAASASSSASALESASTKNDTRKDGNVSVAAATANADADADDNDNRGTDETLEEIVLDDYGDLSLLLDRGLSSGSAFRVVLERYDAASLRDHVARVRTLFDKGAPAVEDLYEPPPPPATATATNFPSPDSASAVQSLVESNNVAAVPLVPEKEEKVNESANEVKDDSKKEIRDVDESDDKENSPETSSNDNVNSLNENSTGGDEVDSTAANDPGTGTRADKERRQKQEAMNNKKKVASTAPLTTTGAKTRHTMPSFPLDRAVAVDGSDLDGYHYLACGEEEALEEMRTGKKPAAAIARAAAKAKAKASKTTADAAKAKVKSKIGTAVVSSSSSSSSSSGDEEGNDYDDEVEGGDDGDNGGEDDKHEEDVATEEEEEEEEEEFSSIRDVACRLNVLDRRTRVPCEVRFGGFHPPPPHRRLLGDLAYLEVTVGGGTGTNTGIGSDVEMIHVTCIPAGFYVNRTRPAQTLTSARGSGTGGGGGGSRSLSSSLSLFAGAAPYVFDPTPADDPCFSHELLDCLLKKSGRLRVAWSDAIAASKERADVQAAASSGDSPLRALFRVAVRGDVSGGDARGVADGIDSVVLRPSWLVPLPRAGGGSGGGGGGGGNGLWINGRGAHEYNPARAEEDVASTFGLDIRGGSARDWNEELQSARELSRETMQERIERARVVHKVLSDFGEAAIVGARAIYSGHITPMNPNEPTRSHVYLHNNIFFSRAVDAGVDTFKICQGDRAARKSAARDAHCMGSLHRLDVDGLHTLATVLVDYLGTRLVCQSIVPGILHGEKTHTLLYGAVEATSPLSWDEDMHNLLEESLGKGLMVATRKVLRMPLSDERIEAIKMLRPPVILEEEKKDNDKDNDDSKEQQNAVTDICGPIEAKGIRGSDQRKYLLDLTRLTPRDANWVPKSEGGTGKWEAVSSENGTSHHGKSKINGRHCYVPQTLEDDEFVMAVLRPELVTSMTHKKMKEWIADKRKVATGKESTDETEEKGNDVAKEAKSNDPDVDKSTTPLPSMQLPKTDSVAGKIRPEDQEYLKTLRLNVNVFLPNAKSIEGIDDEAYQKMKEDEERVREIATHLWDEVLPSITKEIRESGGHNLPVDGRALTELLHQRGVNCRYLGRLASLALEEEAKDRRAEEQVVNAKAGATCEMLPRRVIPLCWLELLECEMVARAAKHVLDTYLTENGGVAAMQPAQTIASFLSALVSTREESAAETETRIRNRKKDKMLTLDEESANSLTLYGVGGGGEALVSCMRSRGEVWNDIEQEVGRRFRYTLTLYNAGRSSSDKKDRASRALYIPLLRRVCQRTGVRLVARNYEVGGRCLCTSSGGRTSASFPISPVDVLDVVPLVKHSAALAGEGFVPCSFDGIAGMPSLHILLPDAKATFEAAHVHWNAKALPQALDLVHEAASLYQRVVDTPLHASVARCLDMTAAILFHANEPELAVANSARALAVAVQLGGFDCSEAVNGHTTLSHILISSGGLSRGMKHLRASLYLMELMAGPRYAEISSTYHKIGSMYHEVGSAINALRFYQEAATRSVSDRLVEGMVAKSTAFVLAAIGHFKTALETEKRAYGIYRLTLGEKHDLTVNSANSLKHFMKLAVEQGTRMKAADRKRREEQAADAVASQIEADEAAEEEKKKKKSKKKKKKKN